MALFFAPVDNYKKTEPVVFITSYFIYRLCFIIYNILIIYTIIIFVHALNFHPHGGETPDIKSFSYGRSKLALNPYLRCRQPCIIKSSLISTCIVAMAISFNELPVACVLLLIFFFQNYCLIYNLPIPRLRRTLTN